MDRWALEYLLACSALKPEHLTIQLRVIDLSSHYLGKLFGWTHAGPSLRHLLIEQFKQLLTQLLLLSSLVLVIDLLEGLTMVDDDNLSTTIHFATTILEHVNRDHLMDIRVEFKASPLAVLGAPLSEASASLDACKQLETALLTCHNGAVLVHEPMQNRRTGRAKFWSPIIRRAFPRLDDRGLLTLKFRPCEWKSVSRCRHERLIPSML